MDLHCIAGIGSAGYFMGSLVIAGNWFRGRQFVPIVSMIYATPAGEIDKPRRLSASEMRTWPQVGCSIANATTGRRTDQIHDGAAGIKHTDCAYGSSRRCTARRQSIQARIIEGSCARIRRMR